MALIKVDPKERLLKLEPQLLRLLRDHVYQDYEEKDLKDLCSPDAVRFALDDLLILIYISFQPSQLYNELFDRYFCREQDPDLGHVLVKLNLDHERLQRAMESRIGLSSQAITDIIASMLFQEWQYD